MNLLEQSIQLALQSPDDSKRVNKAYLEFIKANFLIPIEKKTELEEPEVLFLEESGQIFLPVFSSRSYLDTWVAEIEDNIMVLELSGVDLLRGLGEQVTVCLNINSDLYKEFNPSETARMKNMVLKLFDSPLSTK